MSNTLSLIAKKIGRLSTIFLNKTDVEVIKNDTELVIEMLENVETLSLECRKKLMFYGERNILKINMFPLIKSITAKTKHCIFICVDIALSRYFKTTPTPVFDDKLVLAVVSNAIREAYAYDNDNVEVSAIVNALKVRFMKDDSPSFLSVTVWES